MTELWDRDAACGCEYCHGEPFVFSLAELDDMCRGCGDDTVNGDYCDACYWGKP